jgi:uncharacterized protein
MKPNQAITYSLSGNENDSVNYYNDIARFGDNLLPKLEESLGVLINRLIEYICDNNIEQARSREIYLFEALMLGTFWNVYGGYASGTDKSSVRLMHHTAQLRKHGGLKRRFADTIRAGFAYRLLEKSDNSGLFLFPDTANLRKLINWMQATGEFQREAARFSNWLSFFETETSTYTFINICIIRGFASTFKKESKEILGKYTQHVDRFVNRTIPGRLFREDKISVNRLRVEYHLNMLGAYIYNRALFDEFITTERKVVLLPACMKAKPPQSCKASGSGLGETCAGCSESCMINRITQTGRKYHFKVEIVKHSSDISLGKQNIPPGTGLVGVACVATVISGGLELVNNSIPAQCVLLDHCGCKHWCNKPVATSVNIPELLNRLGINTGKETSINPGKKIENKEIAA